MVPKNTREWIKSQSDSDIGMFDLLRSALRERPEYILVGEVRGPEAQVLFQAMNTGHTTYSTMHAGTIQAVINRLISEPINVPIMMMQALNAVIFQALNMTDGQKVRRCNQIIEITNVDQRTGNLSINEVFSWSNYNNQYERKSDSFVQQKIMQLNGWSSNELNKEIGNRLRILNYMVKKDICDYQKVATIIESYYRSPQLVLNKIMEGTM